MGNSVGRIPIQKAWCKGRPAKNMLNVPNVKDWFFWGWDFRVPWTGLVQHLDIFLGLHGIVGFSAGTRQERSVWNHSGNQNNCKWNYVELCGISSLVLTLSDSSRNSKSQSSPESRSKGLQLYDVVSEDVQREMFLFPRSRMRPSNHSFSKHICGIMWNKGNVSYLAVSKITADEWEC